MYKSTALLSGSLQARVVQIVRKIPHDAAKEQSPSRRADAAPVSPCGRASPIAERIKARPHAMLDNASLTRSERGGGAGDRVKQGGTARAVRKSPDHALTFRAAVPHLPKLRRAASAAGLVAFRRGLALRREIERPRHIEQHRAPDDHKGLQFRAATAVNPRLKLRFALRRLRRIRLKSCLSFFVLPALIVRGSVAVSRRG
jgi:hypothetical protein